MRRDQRSPEAQAYRHLYGSWRWTKRSLAHRKAEPLCRMCLADNRFTPAAVADHVIDHKGDERLFWEGELQSLCKLHHDSTKQRQAHGREPGGVDEDGWPLD